jgi:hypothetical protein
MEVILKHEDVFAKSLDIKITKGNIIDKIDAFDWLDLSEAKSEFDFEKVVLSIFKRFNFKYPKKYDSIIKKAFSYNFIEAVEQIKTSIIAVSKSYNIDGCGVDSFRNEIVDKFYYINYWADKKNIPVNYNEKDYNKRKLFNFDTIILNILADKLKILNDYERNKPKK